MNFDDVPCKEAPTEVFFDWNCYQQVIDIYCSQCHMREECLQLALDAEAIIPDGGTTGYRSGVFGGTTPKERNIMQGTDWRCLNDNNGYSN